jgi:hypothetical protein
MRDVFLRDVIEALLMMIEEGGDLRAILNRKFGWVVLRKDKDNGNGNTTAEGEPRDR